jgi:hypothetical protein
LAQLFAEAEPVRPETRSKTHESGGQFVAGLAQQIKMHLPQATANSKMAEKRLN